MTQHLAPAADDLAAATLSRDEARTLTDEVRGDAERLWRKLVELYEGKAHVALGYGSWHAYCSAEFGMKQSRAYQLLDAGRVVAALDSTNVESPPNEGQARALRPLLRHPEALKEAWSEVVETHDSPTAADVREVVTRRVGEEQPMSNKATMNAEAAKRKLYAALSGINGYCLGLEGFRFDRACAVADPDDLAAWESLAADAVSALNRVRRVIKEAQV